MKIDIQDNKRFSPGTLVSSTNKPDHHDIAEILLKVVLNLYPLSWLGTYRLIISTNNQIYDCNYERKYFKKNLLLSWISIFMDK
jgi:hypothetical protein